MRLSLICACLLATAVAKPSGNMNGKYSVTSIDDLDVKWNDDYASKGHGESRSPCIWVVMIPIVFDASNRPYSRRVL